MAEKNTGHTREDLKRDKEKEEAENISIRTVIRRARCHKFLELSHCKIL